ncbi:MAG: alpha/beta hydrolase [Hyphomonadaceae bacterium]|nr:alpha/beta hydrolase [Hyphomonadaceae bacterium]
MSLRRQQPLAPVAVLVATAVRKAAGVTLALGMVLSAASCETASRDVRFAQVDGHRIAYRVLGAGEPTIVMIAGLGDGMATFQDVAPELAATATVILYDRAGYGGSDTTAGARDAEAAERELSAVLEQSGVNGPYVLIGHSLGGLYAEYFAAQHPDQVLGVVLEESRPADFTHRCEAAGISPCTLPASMAWTLPAGGRAELAALPMTVSEVDGINTARDLPTLVLSRPTPANPSAFDVLWTTTQRDLAARYPRARQLVPQSGGHYVHLDQRVWFVDSVRTFINEARARAAT